MTKWLAMFLLSFIIFTSSAAAQNSTGYSVIDEALSLQNEAVNDPLYKVILGELLAHDDQAKDLGKLSLKGMHEINDKIDWLFKKFEEQGLATESNVTFFKTWKPWYRKTNARANSCDSTFSINRRRINKQDVYGWTNTIIHERIHNFCSYHPESQKRSDNVCHFDYLAGDLAEAILIYRDESSNRKLGSIACPQLCDVLYSHGIDVCR